MKQADLDKEMISQGVDRYRLAKSRLRSANLESRTSAGRRVLEHAVSSMSESLQEWMTNAALAPGRGHSILPLLVDLDPNLVSLVTCKTVIDGITTTRTINSLAMSVARQIEDEYAFLKVRASHPRWWAAAVKKVKATGDERRAKRLKERCRRAGIPLTRWSYRDKAAMGLVCVELMRQSTGLIETENRISPLGKPHTIVRATDEFMNWLEKSHASAEFLFPVYMPMIHPPQDWKDAMGGGYTSEELKRPLVKARKKRKYDGAEMPEVYDAVNRIQRTGFSVNEKVLDVLKECWQNGLDIGDLPSSKPPVFPPFPADGKTNPDSKKTWKRICGRIKSESEQDRSKRIAVHKTIMLADKYRGQAVYYPQELDFRGRVYPKPIFLNNQGSDWQRSLLLFDKGLPLLTDEDRGWLAIHGANCWGIDKVSFAERIEFIQGMHNEIMAIAKAPMENMGWAKADKPFCFLAFCFEYADSVTNPDHVSRLPVHLDGSNNGLQIFSLLLRDPVSGLATNCLPTDTPRDIYQDVAELLKQKLAGVSDPMASRWLSFGIDRKTTKRVVMCLPYGLTRYSSHEYLRDWYLDKAKATGRAEFDVNEIFPAIIVLADALWESIHEIVKSAKDCMAWLREVAKIHIEEGKPIRWSAPSGFPVTQAYRKHNRVTVKTLVGTVIRQHRFRQDKDDLSKMQNVNAISPNFVHSLDAAVLMRAVNMAYERGVRNFSCIHDSIGVLASSASMMAACIREAAIEIFSQPVLHNLRTEMEHYLGRSLPAPPMSGDMDITLLRDADYFFA
jgi:DNA-directed RNA polymerase